MEKATTTQVQVLVCQHGARRRYAVPRLLEEAGMLEALYTDSMAYSLFGKVAKFLSLIGFKQAVLGAVAARIPKGVPHKKVFSSDHSLPSLLKGDPWFDFSPIFKRWGLRDAKVVYSMCGEDSEFLRWAKERGAKIIIDVFVHPSTARIVAEEKSRIKGVPLDTKWIDAVEDHFKRAFNLADILICPSNWVAEGVLDYAVENKKKIRLVPYGSSLKLSETINKTPVPGRILFAGRDPLRKGLHYLAAAAKQVREKGLEIDVHVAGLTSEDVAWMEYGSELNCLGTIPMSQMREEFKQADVFILPSLSEGQAGVVLEAMACGCPVIATRESGVDFDPGCGMTVPARNADALADAILEMLGSQDVRNRYAEGALRQSETFATEAWKKRLVNAVCETAALDKESA